MYKSTIVSAYVPYAFMRVTFECNLVCKRMDMYLYVRDPLDTLDVVVESGARQAGAITKKHVLGTRYITLA